MVSQRNLYTLQSRRPVFFQVNKLEHKQYHNMNTQIDKAAVPVYAAINLKLFREGERASHPGSEKQG